MNSLLAVLMASVISVIITIPMMNLTVQQQRSRAVMTAGLLYRAEIDRAHLRWSEDNTMLADLTPANSERCTFDTQHEDYGYNDEGFNIIATCTVGGQPVGGEVILLAYPEVGNGHFQANSDDDLDGFDDVTGLPTHYWECYSGWKGNDSVKNNCELGGSLVIPAYAHLYE